LPRLEECEELDVPCRSPQWRAGEAAHTEAELVRRGKHPLQDAPVRLRVTHDTATPDLAPAGLELRLD
jgi:hypothetical protein